LGGPPSTRVSLHASATEAAIDPSEDAVSIDATYAMRSTFAADDQDNGALTLLDALIEVLSGNSTNKH